MAAKTTRFGRWLGPTVVVLAAGAMVSWTRGIWPDVLIDFGHEIFVFWRISAGQVLFRDIAHLKGPLSPYFNGLIFRLFGASLQTLVVTNLALFALLAALLYAILARIAGRFAATLAGLTLVLVFGFAQLEQIGSYNFLCPYSHEVTHGVTLSVAAIFLLSEYHRRRRPALLAAAGLATGLAALTDGHVFLAGLAAVVVGVALTLWIERPSRPRLLAACGGFLAGLVLPPLVAFGLLALALPAREAFAGALGSVRFMLRREIVFERLYRWQMGTLDPAASLRSLATWTGWYVVALAPSAWLGATMRRRGRIATLLAGAIFLVVAGTLVLARQRSAWGSAFRPLPLVVLLLAGVCFAALRRAARTIEAAGPWIVGLVLATLSFGLLAKILLNVRVMDYGFALAMPGTLLFVTALFGWLPKAFEHRGWNPAFFRAASLALWGAAVLALLATTGRFVASKTVQVGTGRDAFLADRRGTAVNMALDVLAQRSRPGATLAVMPEGAILNYLARTPNPTPYPVLSPPEVVLYGEERMLAAFQTTPPDRIVFVHADSSIHGVRFFGRDYGERIYAWVMANYRSVAIIGARPFVNERFGIEILERSGPHPARTKADSPG